MQPKTRDRIRTDWCTAFVVIVRCIHDTGENSQTTSPPPSMNNRTTMLKTEKTTGARRSSP